MDAKDFLTLEDLAPQEIRYLLKKTNYIKSENKKALQGKVLALLFEKPSTRTRVSFDVAMLQLGGHTIDLAFQSTQLSRGESIEDTGRVLSRYVDGIVARLYSHNDMLKLASASSAHVINGLTDLLHPCQALSDMYTIKQKIGKLFGKTLVYLGDAENNVTHSLMIACSKLGLNMVISCPLKYYPKPRIMSQAKKNFRKSGAQLSIIKDPERAVKNANIIYTDTWVSMGEKMTKERLRLLTPYQVNSSLISKAKKGVIVMHDLPAHRGREITSEVMDGKHSVIWDQAENRMHVEKALLAEFLG